MSKKIVASLLVWMLVVSTAFSGCKKTETETTEKSRSSKKESTEPEVTETTIDWSQMDESELQDERTRLAGTYECYATQTREETNPEYGTMNDYPMILDQGYIHLILDAEGTAVLKYDDGTNTDIPVWYVRGEDIMVEWGDQDVYGTVKDGIITLVGTYTVFYFTSDGADTSVIGAITSNEAMVVEGDDFYFGLGQSGYVLGSAESCYEVAAESGVGKACYCLGRLYQEKTLEEKHYFTARSYYEQAIELGSPYGYIGLGLLHKKGKGLSEDLTKAYDYFRQAADAGCLLGYVEMANVAWLDGVPGVWEPDGKQARIYYEKALESRDWFERVSAMNGLGLLYQTGSGGVDQDLTLAEEWFRKAAEEGYSVAMKNLGNMYRYGNGVAQDYDTAKEWYEKAAERGCAEACTELGLLYENGEGVKADPAKAAEWYQTAADNGNAAGVYHLACMYDYGTGVIQDYEKAMEYYLIATEEYYPRAFEGVAEMYYEGKGVEKDDMEAFRWWSKGMAFESAVCTARLGWAFLEGLQGEVDYKSAMICFATAIYFGNVEGDQQTIDYSYEMLSEMLEKGYVTQQQVDDQLRDLSII